MTPTIFLRDFITPQLAYLRRTFPNHQLDGDKARMQLLCHALQETACVTRVQIHGPAHTFWQFESGGGLAAIMAHREGGLMLRTLCAELCIPSDRETIFAAATWNDRLALGLARLRLWIDPAPLPAFWDVEAAWEFYIRTWGPGKPDHERWSAIYGVAKIALLATIQDESAGASPNAPPPPASPALPPKADGSVILAPAS